MLSDVVEALLLNGLIVDEALDFGGGAIHIRVLDGGKKVQDNHPNRYGTGLVWCEEIEILKERNCVYKNIKV